MMKQSYVEKADFRFLLDLNSDFKFQIGLPFRQDFILIFKLVVVVIPSS